MTAEEMHEIEEGRREMTVKEAVELIDNRMCFGRGKWSEHHTPTRDIYWIAGEMAIKALRSNPEWIPCEERLPEETGYYIVITNDGLKNRTSYVYYSKKTSDWLLAGRRAYWRVVAWMPLPSPYKEGEEDDDA